MHGGKAKERMLDIVAGQNGDRAIRREIALQQRRSNRAYAGEHRCVGQRTPRTRAVTLREENAIRRFFGPIGEPLGDLVRIGLQRVRRAHEHGAVGSALDQNVRGAEPDRP